MRENHRAELRENEEETQIERRGGGGGGGRRGDVAGGFCSCVDVGRDERDGGFM